MDRKVVFISHISDEAQIANSLKELLDLSFFGIIEVFASSHDQSLPLGRDWIETVKLSIKKADVMIVLCSPLSVTRPWVTFEAGAGWNRGIPVIPLCHSGLEPGKLSAPLSYFQGAVLGSPDNIKRTFQVIADALTMKVPPLGETDLFAIVEAFEAKIRSSNYLRVVRFSNSYLLTSVGALIYALFASTNQHEQAIHLSKGDTSHLLTHPLNFNDMYYLFESSKSMADLGQLSIFESFHKAVSSLIEDVKYILNYRHIEFAPQLIAVLEMVFTMRETLQLWITPLQLIALDDDKINEYMEGIRNTKLEDIPDGHSLWPAKLYYESLLHARYWLSQYTAIVGQITSE